MSLPNFLFGAKDVTPELVGDFYAPDDADIETSDGFDPVVTAAAITFTRPLSDAQGFAYANPGARVRFTTNSTRVQIVLRYTNLVTRLDTYNSVGAVYADGALVDTFSRFQGAAGIVVADVYLGAAASRLIEIVMPYCASVDFEGVYVDTGATFSAPAARPTEALIAVGDSITHGFNGSAGHLGWVFGVAAALDVQGFNLGYGGRVAIAADGTAAGDAAAPFGADGRIVYMIGVNDCVNGVALATFKTAVATFVTNARAAAPSAKIILLTPLYCAAVEAVNVASYPSQIATLASYRSKIVEVETDSADANLFVVNGLSVMTNSTSSLASDQVHPNDTGLAEVIANLPALL